MKRTWTVVNEVLQKGTNKSSYPSSFKHNGVTSDPKGIEGSLGKHVICLLIPPPPPAIQKVGLVCGKMLVTFFGQVVTAPLNQIRLLRL